MSLGQAMVWKSYDDTTLHQLDKDKLLLIKVIRDDCYYCNYMDKKVFSDSAMQTLLLKHFALIKVNISHEAMPLGLEGKMTPTFYFINKQGKVIKRLLGAWSKTDFEDIVQKIIKEQE